MGEGSKAEVSVIRPEHPHRPGARNGGFPARRVVEVFGPESSGKTTLTLTVIAGHRRPGVAFTDVACPLIRPMPASSALTWRNSLSPSRS